MDLIPAKAKKSRDGITHAVPILTDDHDLVKRVTGLEPLTLTSLCGVYLKRAMTERRIVNCMLCVAADPDSQDAWASAYRNRRALLYGQKEPSW
jgi:hypothetical protein